MEGLPECFFQAAPAFFTARKGKILHGKQTDDF
jgi:hypothetical protein